MALEKPAQPDPGALPEPLGNLSLQPPVDPGADGPAPKSYWDLVWLQFCKDRYAATSVVVIVLLLVLAAWAPLLAYGKPFYWHVNGQTSYPLLRDLTAPTESLSIDYLFNWLFFFTLALGPVLGVAWLLARRSGRRLKAFLPKSMLVAMVLALLPFLAAPSDWKFPNIFRSWQMDATPYLERLPALDAAKGDRALFPLIDADPITPTRDYLKKPSSAHWLGTDKDGRDVLARMLHGARISLSVGFVAVTIATLLGILFGALAGYFRGWVDIAISRFIEIVICFPSFFLILTIVAFIEQRSIFHIMLIIGATSWTHTARLVRGEFLKLSDQDFVQAARALGASNTRLMFRHMLPNAMGPVLVAAAFEVAGAILTESGLSYLGFGAPPPTPSWGEMISQGKEYIDEAWWLIVFPGLSIFITVTIYNLAGDGMRDAMDPKMRSSR